MILRNPVITEFRWNRQSCRMAKRDPGKRALAFKTWMASVGTNTKQVATRSGVPYTTLASFVQGDTQSLKGENEELIAKAFGATATEIFADGPGGYAPIIGRVGADTEGTVVFSSGDAGDEEAPIPPGGSAKAVGLKVVGHSMRGVADDGALIFFENQQLPPSPDLLNYVCALETSEGLVLVKRLLKGSRPGTYDLESIVGPTLADVQVKWAAEITAVIPPRQAARIIRSRSERQVA